MHLFYCCVVVIVLAASILNLALVVVRVTFGKLIHIY